MNSYICLECKGTGLTCFIVNEEDKNDIDYIPLYDFIPCETCEGKGYVEVVDGKV